MTQMSLALCVNHVCRSCTHLSTTTHVHGTSVLKVVLQVNSDLPVDTRSVRTHKNGYIVQINSKSWSSDADVHGLPEPPISQDVVI